MRLPRGEPASARAQPRGVFTLLASDQPHGVFALLAPDPKPRAGRAAHGAVAKRAETARFACMARQGFLPPPKKKVRRDDKISGGPQRIPKGYAQISPKGCPTLKKPTSCQKKKKGEHARSVDALFGRTCLRRC